MLHQITNISITPVSWPLSGNRTARFDVARLDALHPVVSGNKWFKLKNNLQEATRFQKKGILTMGGAFSNHLAATAFACSQYGLLSIGLVRGELQYPLNHTLDFCCQKGMQLVPIPRNAYNTDSALLTELKQQYANFHFVPEGGSNEAGISGCSEIADAITDWCNYSHIICAMGTGTTCKGLLQRLQPHQQLWGIPVLRIPTHLQPSFLQNLYVSTTMPAPKIAFNYAGRGYGKGDVELFDFMNSFYDATGIPSDFVYTGKVFKAVIDLLENEAIVANEQVLVLHTGGLQGNASLAANTLYFG